MKKTGLTIGFVVILALAFCVTAYAGEAGNCPINGFFSSIGGFLYNALPWNWGNWMGK